MINTSDDARNLAMRLTVLLEKASASTITDTQLDKFKELAARVTWYMSGPSTSVTHQSDNRRSFIGGGLVTAPDEPTSVPCESDPVNHPAHYTGFSRGSEVIDITENLTFNAGNAIKYLARAGRKTSDPLEDLKKAAWYVNREINRLGNDR